MKHLITGGSGFLGHLIARRLVERGDAVRILDIWEDPLRPANTEFVRCDIRDPEGVARALEGIDVVHHTVALVPLTKSGKDFWDVNVNGSRIIAEAAIRAGVQSFIHMSSSAVYGNPPECPIGPKTPLHPIEIYGRAKFAGEQSVREICGRAGMPLYIIRPRTILGEGRLGIFQILFDWIRQGRRVYVFGDGNIPFQFVHASDLMDAYLLVMNQCRPGDYNVGTPHFGTLREALERLIARAKSPSRVTGIPAPLAMNALRILDWLHLSPLAPWHYLTYHKAFAFDMQPLLELGWKPRYSNDAMLQESYEWFLNHPQAADSRSQSPHRRRVREGILALLKRIS